TRFSRDWSSDVCSSDLAGTGRVDVDDQAVTGALDVDARHGAPDELALQIVADLPVLVDEVDVVLVGVPLRLPVGDDAEAEGVGMCLLAHVSSPLWRVVGHRGRIARRRPR